MSSHPLSIGRKVDNATALVLADAVKDLAAAGRALASAIEKATKEEAPARAFLRSNGEVISKEGKFLFSIDLGNNSSSSTRLFDALIRSDVQKLISSLGIANPLVEGNLIDVAVLVRVYDHLGPGDLRHYGKVLHALLGSWVAQLRSAA